MTVRPRPAAWFALAALTGGFTGHARDPSVIDAHTGLVQAAPVAGGLQSAASVGRTVVVVSDLHMGPGREASGAWIRAEDFRWASEFSAFLEAIDRVGGGRVDLILNGDTFELIQPALGPCGDPSAPDMGCAEREALARLERVLRAHAAETAAIAKFAAAGSNHVSIVAGDTDAALAFPAVARRVVSALSPSGGRVEVPPSGYWLSGDGSTYAEHGHQIGHGPHRFERWPPASAGPSGPQRLSRTWGERLTTRFYGELEDTYPAVDNIVTLGAGLKYAPLPADSVLLNDAPDLLRYELQAISWQQFRMELDDGDVQPPTWDLAQVRAQGPAFLASSVPDDDPLKPLASKALADGKLSTSMDQFSDEELVMVCDYRAAMRRSRRRFEPVVTQFAPRGPAVAECPRTPDTRGAVFDYFWRSRDRVFDRRLEEVATRLPNARRPVVFVHGHTHLADRAQSNANMISGGLLKIPMEGFSPVRGALTPIAINGGAWQRTMTPVQLLRLSEERGVTAPVALRSLAVEDLAPCYSFVQINAGPDGPAPAVRYWRQAASGEWAIAAACGR